jgi:hypothetical protein
MKRALPFTLSFLLAAILGLIAEMIFHCFASDGKAGQR